MPPRRKKAQQAIGERGPNQDLLKILANTMVDAMEKGIQEFRKSQLESEESREGNKCSSCGKNHAGECLKGKGVCFNCGKADHIASSCPKPKKGGCFSCAAEDHLIKDCPKRKTNESNTRNLKRKWKDEKSESKGEQPKKNEGGVCKYCRKKHTGKCLKGKGVCFNCGEGGHMSPDCPKPKKGGCYNCHASGHRIKECPVKKKEVNGGSDLTQKVGSGWI